MTAILLISHDDSLCVNIGIAGYHSSFPLEILTFKAQLVGVRMSCCLPQANRDPGNIYDRNILWQSLQRLIRHVQFLLTVMQLGRSSFNSPLSACNVSSDPSEFYKSAHRQNPSSKCNFCRVAEATFPTWPFSIPQRTPHVQQREGSGHSRYRELLQRD